MNNPIDIQYISDIHLEFYSFNKIAKIANKIIPKSKILVLAGDIGKPVSRIKKTQAKINKCYEYFLNLLSIKFDKIFLITGNHEYYNNLGVSIEEVNKTIKTICENINKSNVIFLNNDYYDYNGYRYIGTTLWTEVDENPSKKLNDLSQIPNMTPLLYNELHYNSVDFLDKILAETAKMANPIPCIIISHHLPLFELIDNTTNTTNTIDLLQWYASDLNELIDDYTNIIKLWIYGHTHYKNMQTIKNIIFAANPIGYSTEMTDQKFVKTVCIQ
jgi:Icc-related predicted phosphoesterase